MRIAAVFFLSSVFSSGLHLMPHTAAAGSADQFYRQHCANCHGAGVWERGDPARLWDYSPQEFAQIIREGLPGQGMPALGEQLSDEELTALTDLLSRTAQGGSMIGATLEAESLNPARSSNYLINRAETRPDITYVGYFDFGSSLCYDDIDLTGIRSIEFEYARGPDAYGRFAILASHPSGLGPRTNLAEYATHETGGWETFERQRVGLARQLEGRHSLCFLGIDGGGIFNLDRFTLSDQPGEHAGFTWHSGDAAPEVITGAGYRFTLEKVAEAEAELWSMAFLPDGSLLATQKNGQLLHFQEGRRHIIEGTPQVWNRGQGGLLAVLPHPQYARNGWIYLSYAGVGRDNTTMTEVARGRINNGRWHNHQVIYRADDAVYSGNHIHFGSRLAIQGRYLYISLGERGEPELAQDLAQPKGKILRLREDGRVPRDNPFARQSGALSAIWSYGHRNPQGLALDPRNGDLWSSEHGPMGGDELNLIRPGVNYGWPLVSFGTHYDGTPIADNPYREGTQPPVHHWTPSTGVSQIAFYTGDKFPAWRGQLLVASLGREELRLVQLNNRELVSDMLIFKDVGRIRDVITGSDGYPYVLLSHPNGAVYRLRHLGEDSASAITE